MVPSLFGLMLVSSLTAYGQVRSPDRDPAAWRIDNFFTDPSNARQRIISVAPTLWWNEASDATVGFRFRSNSKGMDRITLWLSRGLSDVTSSIGGSEVATIGQSLDFRLRFENPSRWASDGSDRWLEGWVQDGTVGARIGTSYRRTAFDLAWVATQETAFLDDRQWDNAGTVEFGVSRAWSRPGSAIRSVKVQGRVGVVYEPNRALFAQSSYSTDPFIRATVETIWARKLVGFDFSVRGFGGVYLGGELPVKQRAITVAGADPYQTMLNPFLRTKGAILAGPDVFYHAPGNLNMRAYRPGLGGRWGASANIELERRVLTRSDGFFRHLGVVGFWDAAVVDTVAVVSFSGVSVKPLHDAGAGIRAGFKIGDVDFPLRIEFPFYVTSPFFAHNRKQGNDFLEFRWLVSVQPHF